MVYPHVKVSYLFMKAVGLSFKMIILLKLQFCEDVHIKFVHGIFLRVQDCIYCIDLKKMQGTLPLNGEK